MENEIIFEVEIPLKEVEGLVKKYYLKNGFYELKTQDGLKFKKNSNAESGFNPKRIYQEISINFSCKESIVEIQKRLKPYSSSRKLTIIDKEYLDDFLSHFKNCMLSNQMEKFQPEINENNIKKYSKNYRLIMLSMTLLAGFIIVFLRLGVLTTIVVWTIVISILPILVIGFINKGILKKRFNN